MKQIIGWFDQLMTTNICHFVEEDKVDNQFKIQFSVLQTNSCMQWNFVVCLSRIISSGDLGIKREKQQYADWEINAS